MERKIITIPDKRLTTPTKEVKEVNDALFKLLDDMEQLMTEHDGIGIAAPQVGSNLRVCLVQLTKEMAPLIFINPKIIEKSGSNIFVEGCLSIPGKYGTVERASYIVVAYFDLESAEIVEAEASDFLARAIQHEIDHLDGILFLDKIIEEIDEKDLEAYYAQFEGNTVTD